MFYSKKIRNEELADYIIFFTFFIIFIIGIWGLLGFYGVLTFIGLGGLIKSHIIVNR